MKFFVRLLITFFLLSVIANYLLQHSEIDFGWTDYWTRHGTFLLIFLALFPRLTLLLSSIPSGGLLWWLGWVFAPRILVALLATIQYWQTNKLLVLCAWLIAWGGESGEKYALQRRVVHSRTWGRGRQA